MARRIPARMISPRRLSARIDCILSLKRCARRLAVHNSSKITLTCNGGTNGPSSNTPSSISSPSPKSMSASTSARQPTISSRSAWNSVRAFPCKNPKPNRSKELALRVGVWRQQGRWRTHPCDAQRRTPLSLRLGVHEVLQPLDLCEIEPATLERAARKLARCGGATSRNARERSKHRADDGASAVHV